MSEFLRFSERLDVLPVVHGSGDFAVRVREQLLQGNYDCVAVPLPGSFSHEVMRAIDFLPAVTAVVQQEPDDESVSYVPIDPCQPVIAALRFAKSDRLAVEFVDLETQNFQPQEWTPPDPYALKQVSPEKFAAAILPALPRPPLGSQQDERVRRMAFELHRLELEYRHTLFVPSLLDWPWIREAYAERRPYPELPRFFAPIRTYSVREETLTFLLGELPYVTALYERARAQLDSDQNLSIDGVKELVLEARDRWSANRDVALFGRSESAGDNWLTPKLMQIYFRYVRNLTLMGSRLTPDMYTLVVAAKQIGGDSFALSLLRTAMDYPIEFAPAPFEALKMGIGQGNLPDAGVVKMKSRLPGPSVSWRSCELRPEPNRRKSKLWQMTWNPYKQCSWPAEDQKIESFHAHVREQAKALIGADLAKTEKFTTSVKDGIDIRETLRHWHTGDLYVREIPPSRGGVEVVIFLFDMPADPAKYPWRTTWHAEHAEESTLGLFATDFRQDMVGPGIGRAIYGGVLFIFPPRYIPDIWTDEQLPASSGLDDRLVAAGLYHSQERHIAIISPKPPRAEWRRLARQLGKRIIHLPLARFAGRMIDRLRVVHVLNGKDVRSYAAAFIRGDR